MQETMGGEAVFAGKVGPAMATTKLHSVGRSLLHPDIHLGVEPDLCAKI
jgi:hypothetical protein